MKIIPTVGRVVHYWPNGWRQDWQPNAALIAYVHSDDCVNLAWFGSDGSARSANSVRLIQEGEDTQMGQPYAEWMPYQKDQAMKIEELERQYRQISLALLK